MKKDERGTIIILGSQKGGVGKSTQATNIAVALSKENAKVALIDTDPQKTSINWIDRRNEAIEAGLDAPKIFGISKEGNVKETIKELSLMYDVVIIDASGYDNKSLRTALTIADIIICPFKPSQADLETLPHVLQIINAAKDFNENLKAYCLISMSPTHYINDELSEAKEFLESHSDQIQVLKSTIAERKVYREALLKGLGVVEMSNQKAKYEIESIIKELF